MADEIPQWAIDRACAMFNDASHNGPWDSNLNRCNPVVVTFARYIAAHEEPPVDPLAEEAQELADQLSINLSAMPWVEGVLLTALRRGMELAKSKPPALENGNV